ncbi:MAG: hypothetical protein GY855_05115 [candidate division Zixibacteria bacterium]|nr:hypothetical protein [candidate division Zixibacteria bacterium]
MICVGCGVQIKVETFWVGEYPFCSPECAETGVDEEFLEDDPDDSEYDDSDENIEDKDIFDAKLESEYEDEDF